MVLGKLLVPGRPSNLDKGRAMASCACSRCRRRLFEHFFVSSLNSLPFLPVWRRPDIY